MDNILAIFGLLITVKGLLVWIAPGYTKTLWTRLMKLSNAYFRLLGLTLVLLGVFTLWLAWLRQTSFPV